MMDWIEYIKDILRYCILFVCATLPLHFFIWWQNNELGPFILDSQGFISEITAQAGGIIIDQTLGGHYFYPILTWIVGSLFYVLVWGSLICLPSYYFFIDTWSFVKNTILYLLICSVIIAIYYFHILDNLIVFRLISINTIIPKRVNEYFITAMAIGISYGVYCIYNRVESARYEIYID